MKILKPLIKEILTKSLATVGLIALSSALQADDVEIYRAQGSADVQPNVMFIFDTSGSMSWSSTEDDDGPSRMSVAKEAALSIIGDETIQNVNLGLARFDTVRDQVAPVEGVRYALDQASYNNRDYLTFDGGGLIQVPAKNINDPEHRNRLLSAINELPSNARTPLVETYDETVRYLLGEPVRYGKKYGKTECSEPGYVTVQAPDRVEEIRECYYCDLRYRGPRNCRSFFGGAGNVYPVADSLCENPPRRSRRQYDWIVVDTQVIPGESYEEWRDGGCYRSNEEQYFYISNSESYDESTGDYISPINNSCQKNHIVIFTDGESNYDDSSDTRIREKIATVPLQDRLGKDGISTNCRTASGQDSLTTSCLEEFALYNYTVDQFKDSDLAYDPNPNTEETQRIVTHTIGAFLGDNQANIRKQLELTAQHSNGMFSLATSTEEIRNVLRDLFEIFDEGSSIGNSSPAVAVNALNRLESSEDLFYTVFEPKATKGWSGNLKRYKLGYDGEVKDKNGNSAVDPETGYFSDDAQGVWSDVVDGRQVSLGGTASHLTLERNVVTYLGGDDLLVNDPLVQSAGADQYIVAPGIPTNIFREITNIGEITNLYKWASGITTDTEGQLKARKAIEDPLHSEPLLVQYGSPNQYESVIYFGTNSGFIHAFNTDIDNPKEHFSYIPAELLPNLEDYYRGAAEIGKVYGMDGAATAFIFNESDLKNNLGNASIRTMVGKGDKAFLYMGMRRGGETYHALDVTNPNAPKYLWEISAGDDGFERLGQTWSAMQPIFVSKEAIGMKIKEGEAKTLPVLVFGGGYDLAEDDTSGKSRIEHTVGNAIYMVNALTGELVWSASPDSTADLQVPNMKSAIASNITPVDNNGDGTIDILYAADLGGRVWRIDLLTGGENMATELADLNGGDAENNTRFYTSPVVSYHSDTESYVISIGSGYRAHPLVDDNQDRYFILFDTITSVIDTEIVDDLQAYTTTTLASMSNIESLESASETTREKGFYIELPGTAEKALTDSITADNVIYFATYSPTVAGNFSGLEGCSAATGSTSLYSVSIEGYSFKHTEAESPVVETTPLKQSGIPAKPRIVFPPSKPGVNEDGESDGDECVISAILVGSESVTLESCTSIVRNYWREL